MIETHGPADAVSALHLAQVPDEQLSAGVLRRGDKMKLAGVMASVPDDRLYWEFHLPGAGSHPQPLRGC